MMERVDVDGRWESDDGEVWALVEPSDVFLSGRPADIAASDPILVAAEAIRDEITERIAPSSVNSIAEVKAAVIGGLDAAVERLS